MLVSPRSYPMRMERPPQETWRLMEESASGVALNGPREAIVTDHGAVRPGALRGTPAKLPLGNEGSLAAAADV